MKERKWYWIGHTLWKPHGTVETHWTRTLRVQGRGVDQEQPEKSTIEWEMQKAGKSLKETKGLALDRTKRKSSMRIFHYSLHICMKLMAVQ